METPKFPQRVTFIATLETNDEGMDWEMASNLVRDTLLVGEDNRPLITVDLIKVIRMEIVEGDK